MSTYFVYILCNRRNGTLYTGVTADLSRRISEHTEKVNAGFTEKYNINQLVYYETHEDIIEAITREKNIKSWRRQWKMELIENQNPDWIDLSAGLCFK